MDKNLAFLYYENGRCPDCGRIIDINAKLEESCPECGHVWWGLVGSVVDDETLRILEAAKQPHFTPTMTGNTAFPIKPAIKCCSPCNEPCSKCGSVDAHRVFRRKNQVWRLTNSGTNDYCRKTEFVSYDRYDGVALQDCITHHCRCCGYEWETKPLS